MSDWAGEAVKKLKGPDFEDRGQMFPYFDAEAAAEYLRKDLTPKEFLRIARDTLLETVPEGGTVTRECMVTVFNEILGEKP